MYHCSLPALMALTGSARSVLDFAVNEMDKDNLITNGAIFKKDLNKLMSIHGKPLSDNTVNKAFAELNREDLLLKTGRRGLYRVNPIYFFKGTEDERLKAIRIEAERPIEDSAKKVRDRFVDKFK